MTEYIQDSFRIAIAEQNQEHSPDTEIKYCKKASAFFFRFYDNNFGTKTKMAEKNEIPEDVPKLPILKGNLIQHLFLCKMTDQLEVKTCILQWSSNVSQL